MIINKYPVFSIGSPIRYSKESIISKTLGLICNRDVRV